MFKRLGLIPLLLFVPAATAQVETPPAYPQSEIQMQVPPPVSAMGFPNIVGSHELSNYIRGDIGFSGGYVNNLYPGSGSTTMDDSTFSIQPGFSIDRTTDRIHETLRYTPTFDFYSPDGSLNTYNQSGSTNFQSRITPYTTLLIGDTATRTSTTWSQPSSGPVSGGLPPTSPGFVAPFAPQLSNRAYAQLAWQFSMNSMIGFAGNSTYLDYYKPAQAQGLFNSNSRSASAFYTHRLGTKQYMGAFYQYSFIVGTPVINAAGPRTVMEANDFLGFYTFYLQPTISISLGAGSQRYSLNQSAHSPVQAWAPIALASIGWQVPRANFALNYSRAVTQGEGVIGDYTSNAGSLSAQLLLTPNWLASISGTYSQLKPADVSIVNSTPGGHTLSFAGMLQRQLGPRLSASVQYQYLRQTYLGIDPLVSNPSSSRATASITYHFSRLLGR